MTNADPNRFNLLLPALKPDCAIRAGSTAGDWTVHPSKAFRDVAESLDYQAPGEIKSISSVPTLWARPMTAEMALHSTEHPIHRQMVEQWQGMLAAIALAEVRGFPLKAELLELETVRQNDRFGRSLWELLPDPSRALYRENNKHPWQDLYIFLWDGKPVGMSSPSTLVVPSEEGRWASAQTALPWWKNNRLQAPGSALNQQEKELLWRWLKNLREGLYSHAGELNATNHTATNTLNGLIGNFQSSLLSTPPKEQHALLSPESQFFGVTLSRGVLRGLNSPVRREAQPSSVKVVASPDKKPAKPLLIIDPNIAKEWNKPNQDIWVHGGTTLAALPIEELRSKQIRWEDVLWVEPEQLFLPKLTFIDHRDDALPGAWKPQSSQPLVLEGEKITPLLPLNSLLLEYFTAEDLCKRVKFQPLMDGGEQQIRVSLELPLTGDPGEKPKPYVVSHIYTLNREDGIEGLPILEIWPHFRSPNWKEYFGFYYDAELENTFQVRFPGNLEEHEHKDVRGGIHQMIRLDQFPEAIECVSRQKEPLGLILPKPKAIVANLSGNWKVGVDFGTSFTNVYINRKQGAERLDLKDNLHLKITESDSTTRFLELFEYFIPEEFLPTERPLPLSTVLTEQGSRDKSRHKNKPSDDPDVMFDGRIFVPTVRFNPKEDYINTDLKWKQRRANRLFRKHLALHISALAHKNGIGQLNWALSYPSAFSHNERNEYAATWKKLTKDLGEPRTGMVQNCSSDLSGGSFRTESEAMAQYFADHVGENLTYTTCIDMGGGTSDIAIWENKRLVHQCSVQLAGRDLLSQFLERKPQFIERKFENITPKEWQGLKGAAFSAKLDVLLRWESEKWLELKRAGLTDDPEFRGLVQLMTIGVAGLYYYVGTLLRTLNREGFYSRQAITPVYLGGNGSRLLNWLEHTGSFNDNSEIQKLLSRMLSLGTAMTDKSGQTLIFPDSKVKTVLSSDPKDEVACGLVLDDTKLEEREDPDNDFLIAGEDYELNGVPYNWYNRINIEEDVESFKLPKLDRLSMFLYDFHESLRSLKIEGIKPLKGYNRSQSVSGNPALWEGTQRNLEDLLSSEAFKGDYTEIRFEPPFILGLKALLSHLGREWSKQ
jgi:hypothetical protein